MTDVTEFLLAQITDDEVAARRSMPGPWAVAENRGRSWIWSTDSGYDITQAVANGPTAAHIARWDPTHVLAECQAKRRIVGLHVSIQGLRTDVPHLSEPPTDRFPEWWEGPTYAQVGPVCDHCADVDRDTTLPVGAYPCPMLKLLTLPYVDHPDYDEAWRP